MEQQNLQSAALIAFLEGTNQREPMGLTVDSSGRLRVVLEGAVASDCGCGCGGGCNPVPVPGGSCGQQTVSTIVQVVSAASTTNTFLKAGKWYKSISWQVTGKNGANDGFDIGVTGDPTRFAVRADVSADVGTAGNTLFTSLLSPWLQGTDDELLITPHVTGSGVDGTIAFTAIYDGCTE